MSEADGRFEVGKGGKGAPLGNHNATKNKPFWEAVTRAIKQEDGKRLREAAEQLLTAAANGEPWAINTLADRLDGKAHQSVDIANPDGTGIFTHIERVILKNDKA
jgi:hypothetical protein